MKIYRVQHDLYKDDCKPVHDVEAMKWKKSWKSVTEHLRTKYLSFSSEPQWFVCDLDLLFSVVSSMKLIILLQKKKRGGLLKGSI